MIVTDLNRTTTLDGYFVGNGKLDFEIDLGRGQMMRVSIDLPPPPEDSFIDFDEGLNKYFPGLMDQALRSLYFQVREEAKVPYFCTTRHLEKWKTRRAQIARSAMTESHQRTHSILFKRRGRPREYFHKGIYDQAEAGKSLAEAAAALGISKRWIQEILKSDGEKYSKLKKANKKENDFSSSSIT